MGFIHKARPFGGMTVIFCGSFRIPVIHRDPLSLQPFFIFLS